jgi:hypothetical protein
MNGDIKLWISGISGKYLDIWKAEKMTTFYSE